MQSDLASALYRVMEVDRGIGALYGLIKNSVKLSSYVSIFHLLVKVWEGSCGYTHL